MKVVWTPGHIHMDSDKIVGNKTSTIGLMSQKCLANKIENQKDGIPTHQAYQEANKLLELDFIKWSSISKMDF